MSDSLMDTVPGGETPQYEKAPTGTYIAKHRKDMSPSKPWTDPLIPRLDNLEVGDLHMSTAVTASEFVQAIMQRGRLTLIKRSRRGQRKLRKMLDMDRISLSPVWGELPLTARALQIKVISAAENRMLEVDSYQRAMAVLQPSKARRTPLRPEESRAMAPDLV